MKYMINDETKDIIRTDNDDLKIDDYRDMPKSEYCSYCANFTIERMIEKFGEDSQIDVCIEEMSELIKELIKYKRAKIHENENNPRRKYVLEETGDVLFMIEYLKYIFKISEEEVENIIIEKSIRTAERYL